MSGPLGHAGEGHARPVPAEAERPDTHEGSQLQVVLQGDTVCSRGMSASVIILFVHQYFVDFFERKVIE